MTKANTQLSLYNKSLTLYRYPEKNNERFQAWDAGDEYLIKHLEELQLEDNQNILILNDNFGALCCWLAAKHNVTMMSDSYISHLATQKNLERNQCHSVKILGSLDTIPSNIDLVLLQIPKNNRYLMWQLTQLNAALPESCPVIAVNKAKAIHTSTLKLFEKYLGKTSTSLAWKKHRLVFSVIDKQNTRSLEPKTEWQVDGENYSLINLPNTYSGESLDLGARFMLQHLPQAPKAKHIIDLGCGNGVLAAKIAQLNPQATITCVDESFMALESARLNLTRILGKAHQVNYMVNNCLEEFEPESADLIICNPPFHQNNAITDHIAWQMFSDAKKVLGNKGKLLVIGNRHLEYNVKLSRLFGRSQVTQVASNNKFVILQASK